MISKFINNHFHVFCRGALVAVFEKRNDYIAYVYRAAGGKV